MLNNIKKFAAAGTAVLTAFLAYRHWGEPQGTAWLVASLSWITVFFDSE